VFGLNSDLTKADTDSCKSKTLRILTLVYGIIECIICAVAVIYSISSCITKNICKISSRTRNTSLFVFKTLLALLSVSVVIMLSVLLWKDQCRSVDTKYFSAAQILVIVYWSVTCSYFVCYCTATMIAVCIDAKKY
jgi:hypothetical protein